MFQSTLIVAMFGAISACGSVASANNTSFLPGDAYFFARLSQNDIAAIQQQNSPTLEYGNWKTWGRGCGFAGHSKLRIPAMPKSMRDDLAAAFSDFAAATGTSALETRLGTEEKLMCVFIHNEDYDWQEHGLAIQYNEEWVAETVAFGYAEEHVVMETFVSSAGAITNAWRDSPRIPRLKATVPEKAGDREFVPEATGDLQLIVVPKTNFDDYFARKSDLPLVVITKNGSKSYTSRDGRWTEK
ncbi:MAG: hypothetical protein WED34_06320 [Planctomycetales bacterium]